jgi:hypothetical protein
MHMVVAIESSRKQERKQGIDRALLDVKNLLNRLERQSNQDFVGPPDDGYSLDGQSEESKKGDRLTCYFASSLSIMSQNCNSSLRGL